MFYSYNDVFIKQFHRWSGMDLTRSVRRCILGKTRSIRHGSPQITRGRLLRSHADGAGMATSGLCGWLLGDACCAVLDGFEAWVATAALVLGGEEIPSITLVSTGRAQDGNTLVCVCVLISWHRRCTFKDDSSAPRVPTTKNDTFCVCYVHMCSHVVCHMAKDAHSSTPCGSLWPNATGTPV